MDILNRNDIHGVLNTGLDVVNGQIRVVVVNDGAKGDAIPDQFQHILDRYPSAGDTGFPEMNPGTHLDSVLHIPMIRTRRAGDKQFAIKCIRLNHYNFPHAAANAANASAQA